MPFKPFQDYLSKPCNDSFIITHCIEDEFSKIISEFNNKSGGINKIPSKILKLAKQSISNHLFKISFFLLLFFHNDLKQQRLHQFSKRVPNLNSQIVNHFCYYLM